VSSGEEVAHALIDVSVNAAELSMENAVCCVSSACP
jgi:hypothetical protein